MGEEQKKSSDYTAREELILWTIGKALNIRRIYYSVIECHGIARVKLYPKHPVVTNIVGKHGIASLHTQHTQHRTIRKRRAPTRSSGTEHCKGSYDWVDEIVGPPRPNTSRRLSVPFKTGRSRIKSLG